MMGVGSGCVAAVAAYRSSQNAQNFVLSLVVSLFLTALMGTRFIQSGKFMPAGMVAVLSLVMALRYGYRAIGTTNNKTE